MEKVTHDTVELLKECSNGVWMGVKSIEDVEDRIQSPRMRSQLTACRQKHERLGSQINDMLTELGEKPGEANPVARGMAWVKTNVKMALEMSDQAAAELLTDGCNMGAKSLTEYLNRYENAQPMAKEYARELIKLEGRTVQELRDYL